MQENRSSYLGFNLLEEAESFADEIVAWRREFHQFPELAFEENITASRIVQYLSGMDGMEVIKGFGADTSVIGVLRGDLKDDGGKPISAVALRTETDALAVAEQTGLPFQSCILGVMHACGHDAHMAALLGAAKLLCAKKDELKRPVVFVFQPGEEGRGGGKVLTEAGLIEEFNIGQMLGVLLWPSSPFGHLSTKRGAFTALSDRVHLAIQGVGGHAALPHKGVDPVFIAAQIIIALQGIISREISPTDEAVLSLCQLEAGFAYNIIPEEAHIWGALRAFDSDVRDFAQTRISEVASSVAKAFRATASVEYVRNYPQVENDAELTQQVLDIASEFFDEGTVDILDKPLLSGEDFSFYSLKVPSCLMLLGTGSECSLHHPKYDIPEDILPVMAAWEANLAMRLAGSGGR